jgi:hypothetical protein
MEETMIKALTKQVADSCFPDDGSSISTLDRVEAVALGWQSVTGCRGKPLPRKFQLSVPDATKPLPGTIVADGEEELGSFWTGAEGRARTLQMMAFSMQFEQAVMEAQQANTGGECSGQGRVGGKRSASSAEIVTTAKALANLVLVRHSCTQMSPRRCFVSNSSLASILLLPTFPPFHDRKPSTTPLTFLPTRIGRSIIRTRRIASC